ncbi:HNHc domain containing protein [uncultured Caudovirales phage]|uniref:HNHc domain containing protein n=1 Tax=uncultured Caudovirales phage TaxID=2100421 RepID=A0A6J5KIV8_9CAUD|nr:HNHc domain containing protein [uncultured Caudovirales phage]
MPTYPISTKCASLGCKETRGKYNSFCSEHGGVRVVREDRKQHDSMYNTSQWRTKRRVELSRNPLCSKCLCNGKVVQASHVDHVFPWSVIGIEAFYNNLFQSLCPECHSYKTGQEQKGLILYYKDGHEAVYRLSDYRLKAVFSFET